MATPDTEQLSDGVYYADKDQLGGSADLDIDANTVSRTPVEIQEIIHGNDCDVKIVRGAVEATLDSFTGEGISQNNHIKIVPGLVTLRITATSGSAADFAVMGVPLRG